MIENIFKAISREHSHSDLYMLSLIGFVSKLCPMTRFLRNDSFPLFHYQTYYHLDCLIAVVVVM